MKLYLSSDDLRNDKNELEKWIKKYGRKLILIPNAMDTYYEYQKRAYISREEENLNLDVGFETKVVSLKDYFGKPDELKKDFKEYNAFLAVGGNVFVLRKAMQLSGFDKFLKEISDKDQYLYGGYSAGICVLSKSLHGFDLVDPAINPYDDSEVLYDGIGLLDYMPLPHYKSNDPESIKIDEVEEYCKRNNKKYKTLRNGEVIIEDIGRDIER